MAETYLGQRVAWARVQDVFEEYRDAWPAECILLDGIKSKPKGYVEIRTPIQRSMVPAHRYMWFLAHGKWPDETIDHVKARGCVGKNCINLSHMEDVSVSENSFRRWGSNMGRFTCGHPRELSNTVVLGSTYSPLGQCRTCVNSRQREKRLMRAG